jgi:phospholipid/cholesterol/gamma-HCH transport system substrate-binding protein
VLNGGGIGQISTIVRELDAALHGRARTGKALIARINDVLGQLNDHSEAIDATLQAVADLSAQLGAQHRLIVRGLSELAPGIRDLHEDTAAFTKLLGRLSSLGETATQVLGSVQGTLLTDLDDLAPTLDTLVSLRGKLGSTLQGLLDFARLLNRAIPGDYLNLVGKIQAP